VLAAWELIGRIFKVSPSVLPTPSRVLLEVWRQASLLKANGEATLEDVLFGLGLALLVAAPVSYVISVSPGISSFAAPMLSVTRRAPMLALAPVLLIWAGFGALPKVLTVLLMAFFPVVEGILTGLLSIPEETTELLRIMRAGRLQILFKVRVPGSLPGFFDGLKTALGPAVSGAIVAEFVAADEGLGYLMLSGFSKIEVPLVFAALTILTAMALALYVLVILLERISIPWHLAIVGRRGVCRGGHEYSAGIPHQFA
jgi:NitT/TauT family transport system permease protein